MVIFGDKELFLFYVYCCSYYVYYPLLFLQKGTMFNHRILGLKIARKVVINAHRTL